MSPKICSVIVTQLHGLYSESWIGCLAKLMFFLFKLQINDKMKLVHEALNLKNDSVLVKSQHYFFLCRCGDLNQPPIFRAPLDHFYCCEWDPIFINVDFITNKLIQDS